MMANPAEQLHLEDAEIRYALALRAKPTDADLMILRIAMNAFFYRFGFTALHLANAEAEAQLARDYRATLAREGWIA